MTSLSQFLNSPKTNPGAVLRLDYRDTAAGPLGKFERHSSGHLKIPARFTRTGVLEYSDAALGVRREYRAPEAVFSPESIASFKNAPVTIGHPPGGKVDPSNWRELSVGHVENVRAEGRFLAGDLIISDAEAIAALESGDLKELSPGYSSKLVRTPGTSPDGEAFDMAQTDIRYNHIALLPRGAGRSGPEVSVRTDSGATFTQAELDGMHALSAACARLRLDGPALSPKVPSKQKAAKVQAQNRARLKQELDASGEELGPKITAPSELPEELGHSSTSQLLSKRIAAAKAPVARGASNFDS